MRCWRGREVLQPRGGHGEVSQQLALQLQHDPDPTSGSKESQKHQDQTCSSVFRAALFTAAKTGKRPKCPRTDQEDAAHTSDGILAMKNNKTVAFATWMDLEGVMLSATSQRKTNAVWYHLQVESKDNELGNITERKQTHRYGKD